MKDGCEADDGQRPKGTATRRRQTDGQRITVLYDVVIELGRRLQALEGRGAAVVGPTKPKNPPVRGLRSR